MWLCCVYLFYILQDVSPGACFWKEPVIMSPQKLFFLLDMFFIYDRDIDRFDTEKFMIWGNKTEFFFSQDPHSSLLYF